MLRTYQVLRVTLRPIRADVLECTVHSRIPDKSEEIMLALSPLPLSGDGEYRFFTGRPKPFLLNHVSKLARVPRGQKLLEFVKLKPRRRQHDIQVLQSTIIRRYPQAPEKIH
jgi:hypothetical protein